MSKMYAILDIYAIRNVGLNSQTNHPVKEIRILKISNDQKKKTKNLAGPGLPTHVKILLCLKCLSVL